MLSIILVKDLPRLSLTANSKATSVAKQQRFFKKAQKPLSTGLLPLNNLKDNPANVPALVYTISVPWFS